MPDYPEHEKLHAVVDKSQAIGEFLDIGLPQMKIHLFEEVTRDCECRDCERGGGEDSEWHTDAEKATCVNGRVQVTEFLPCRRSVKSLLSEWFGIDQRALDEEKDAMLADIRKVNEEGART